MDESGVIPALDPQAYCTQVTKAAGSNFYYAFLPMARERREAMFVIYAFCRHADDLVDEETDPIAASRALEAWRAETRSALDGNPGHPITTRLAQVVDAYGIDPKLPFELLDGMAMDIGEVRFHDFDALYQYCYRAASVVGLMCIRIFGCTHPNTEAFAVAHGMAFQLTNIVRDVAKDAAIGRIYLPRDDMDRFRVSADDLLGGRYRTPEFRALLAFESQRAAEWYARAADIARRLPALDRRALLPSRIMGTIYRAVLDEVVEREYRVDPPVSLSAPRKLLLAGRAVYEHLLDRW